MFDRERERLVAQVVVRMFFEEVSDEIIIYFQKYNIHFKNKKIMEMKFWTNSDFERWYKTL